MQQKFIALTCLSAMALAAGCSHSKKASIQGYISIDNARSASGLMGHAISVKAAPVQESPRFIAVHHKFIIVSSETALAKATDSVIQFCGTIRCELISSSVTARTPESSPSASISLRVAPDDFPKLLTHVEKQGNIVQHTAESVDKTSDVVDTEARLKNLTAYRDSLRSMLSRPSLSIKDSVDIQEKLTDVQSDLDSQTAKRKVLANETEKIAVDIEFRVENPGRQRSAFAPLWEAFSESGMVLAESLGSVLTFVVAAIPWLLLILLAGWLIRRLWRRMRRPKKVASPAATAL